jgi:hypothetical protein
MIEKQLGNVVATVLTKKGKLSFGFVSIIKLVF